MELRIIRLHICVIAFVFIFIGCRQLSPAEQEISDNLNKTVNLEIFQHSPVYHKDIIVSLDELLSKHSFISIVYLKDGCAPCYPKFINWHTAMDSIYSSSDYTVLFIIEGNIYSSYENLIQNVLKTEEIETKFYTIIDTNFNFLDANKDIPVSIIERSMLVDEDNKIRLIGQPFSSSGMRSLFLNIVES